MIVRCILLSLLACFASILVQAQAPPWAWAKSAGGSAADRAYGIATDDSGNVYVTGWFASPTITFGNTTLTNTGNSLDDIFVVKYNASGQVVWAKSAGGNTNDDGFAIAVDDSGYVFVTGAFNSSTLIYGSDTLTNSGDFDIVVAKYDASGQVLWAKKTGGSDWDSGGGIATDGEGNVYVTGQFFSASIAFDGDTLINAGHFDIFTVKYDASGHVLWAKNEGGTASDQGYGITNDYLGHVFTTGCFINSAPTFVDVCVVKYDSLGHKQWVNSPGGTGTDVGYGITTDASGCLYVTGRFDSPFLVFGSDTLNSAGGDDIFVTKYDTAGNAIWARSAGGSGIDWGIGIAADPAGNLYVTGKYNSPTIAFGNTILTNAGGFDLFITKYDSSGNVLWAKSAGNNGYDQGNGLAIDPASQVYVTGWFSDSCIFDSDSLTSAGSEDVFIARLAPLPTGLAEEKNILSSATVFPNPSLGKFTLSFPQPIPHASVKIFNLFGQVIYSDSLFITKNKEIYLTALPGIYFLKIQDGERTFVQKILVE